VHVRVMQEKGRSIDEDRWYTSLIGKYSSLSKLVDILRKHKVIQS
jgi:hypothetical protein